MVRLNHTIIWSSDPVASARFASDLLGLPRPAPFARFQVVELGDGVSLDFAKGEGAIQTGHYAFLVGEDEFDAIMRRIAERELPYWADPLLRRPGRINRNDDGRGAYFLDPDGHNFEIITRPYGSSED